MSRFCAERVCEPCGEQYRYTSVWLLDGSCLRWAWSSSTNTTRTLLIRRDESAEVLELFLCAKSGSGYYLSLNGIVR